MERVFKKNKAPKKILLSLIIAFTILSYAVFQNTSLSKDENEEKVSTSNGKNEDTELNQEKDIESLWSEENLKTLKGRREAAEEVTGENVTETNILSSELGSIFINILTSETGEIQDIDNQALKQVSDELVETLKREENLDDQFQISDLSIVENEKSKQQMYSSSFDGVVKERYNLGTEMAIIIDLLETGHQYFSNELKEVSDEYLNFSEDLNNLETPESLSRQHLNLSNSAFKVHLSLKKIKELKNDPVIAITGIKQYRKYRIEFLENLQQIRTNIEKYERF